MGSFDGYGWTLFVMLLSTGSLDATKVNGVNREKRAVTCEPKYQQITTDHTACLEPSNLLNENFKGVPETDKQIIVDVHNTVRKEVNPSATNMVLMIVLVGDLVQLPPVPCARYNEDGAFCFESDIYRKAFPHRIRLQQVHRQTEPLLIKAIEEVSAGILSIETREFINKLSVPLKHLDDSTPVKLFSTNDLVDDFNRDQILKFPGQLHEFLSNDTGEKKYFKEVMACRKLWLKIGIPVILIKNLSDRLVNGLCGAVYDILEDGRILVEFQNITEKIYIKKEKFEVFEPRRNCVVATREQLPLKPAYALTIHKSQGLTLDRVEVDCRDIFKPGQLGVAIGRARTSDGLRVVNFSERTCRKQPDEVLRLNDECDSLAAKENRICCVGHESSTTVETTITVQDLRDIDVVTNDDCQTDTEDLDDAFNDIIYALDDTWDDEIANTAQRWAERCEVSPLTHDGNYKRYAFGRFSVGQNLAAGHVDWAAAMKAWEDEKFDYNYHTDTIPSNKVIGHYTQMIWATSSKIGCGYARCGTTNYYVCNYGPAGNGIGKQPYESGVTCAACQGNCNNGLCDCGEKVCLNGGTMDLNTCTCTCKSGLAFFEAPTCGLNCNLNQEASWCNQYGSDTCETYTNVPQECPLMCNWCPTAAYVPPSGTTQPTDTTESSTPSTPTPTSPTEATDGLETTTATASSLHSSVVMILHFVCFRIFVL